MYIIRRNAATLRRANTSMAPGVSGTGMGGPTGISFTRYNPVFDDLSRGSIAEDMMPKDQHGLIRLWRLIDERDAVGGTGLEIFSDIPFSDFTLSNVRDPKILQIYEDAKDAVKLHTRCPDITREWLGIGRCAIGMIMDPGKGYWTALNVHEAEYLDIKPIPVTGFDPKINLKPTPELQRFVHSKDPRDIRARMHFAPETIRLILADRDIPLNPDNTCYLVRRARANDHLGRSLFSRMIPFLAIEKALINGEIHQVRRAVGPRLHIKAGIQDLWEATNDELQDLVDLFMRSEEDPVGAVVATRLGVEANDLGGGKSQFWTYDESFEFLQLGKMRAIGLHESLLSGESTFNNMEHARSLVVERMQQIRSYIKDHFIIGKFYKVLAEAHGFYRRTEAEIKHRIRTTQPTEEQLDLPDIEWVKQLKPESDLVYLDVLKVAEEKGIPIPVRVWSAAAGIDYDKVMTMLEGDIKERKRIKLWRRSVDALGEPTGDQAVEDTKEENEELPRADEIPTIQSSIRRMPIWRQERFLGLTLAEALKLVEEVMHQPELRNGNLASYLERKPWTQAKRELAGYVLSRSRLAGPVEISQDTYASITNWLVGEGELTVDVMKELQMAQRMVRRKSFTPRVISQLQDIIPAAERSLSDADAVIGYQP